MENATEKKAKAPALAALAAAARGLADEEIEKLMPKDNEETLQAWEKVVKILQKRIPEQAAQAEAEQAILDYAVAAEYLAMENGLRLAFILQDDIRALTAGRASL